jgi:hypothetical protein
MANSRKARSLSGLIEQQRRGGESCASCGFVFSEQTDSKLRMGCMLLTVNTIRSKQQGTSASSIEAILPYQDITATSESEKQYAGAVCVLHRELVS